MKRFSAAILSAITLLQLATPAAAQSLNYREKFRPFLTREKNEVYFNVGVRQTSFDWNIASDTTGTATPNILSDLTWEDINVLEFKGGVRRLEPADIGRVRGDLLMEAELGLGVTMSGDNQDSDYLGDNRAQEFSRSNNDAAEGYTANAAVALGYQFNIVGPNRERARRLLTSRPASTYRGKLRQQLALSKLTDPNRTTVNLTPLVGYGWDQQEYKIRDGIQTINTIGAGLPAQGSALPDSNTEYVAEWYGPFIGLEGEIKSGKGTLRLRGEYHDLTYYGEGFWRARLAFRQDPSFIHEAEGEGINLTARYGYALGPNHDFLVNAMYRKRNAEDGDDTLNLSDGTTSRTRLNEVNEESYGLHLGLQYNW